MTEIIAKLRYFPLGPIAGPAVSIVRPDLDAIAKKHKVAISLENVKGKNASTSGDTLTEETMNSAIEEISQSLIVVTSDTESSFREAIKEIIKKYRAPRTVFGTWGSSERGKQIVTELCDVDDGWK
jgi:hypothetical protein